MRGLLYHVCLQFFSKNQNSGLGIRDEFGKTGKLNLKADFYFKTDVDFL